MLQFKAFSFFTLSARLGEWLTLAGQENDRSARFSEQTAAEYATQAGVLQTHCLMLEAKASAKTAERMRVGMTHRKLTRGEFFDLVQQLDQRLEDELSSMMFFYLPLAKLRYYEAKHLAHESRFIFGEDVRERYPGLVPDIEQAGKCFALGRYTASVFHLMRVLEGALHVLKRPLGITTWSPTWNASITAIRNSVTKQSRRRISRKLRERNAFLEECANYLQSIANAWRNPTMHRVNRNYDEEEAEDVFNAVGALLRYMARTLPRPDESPQRRPRVR